MKTETEQKLEEATAIIQGLAIRTPLIPSNDGSYFCIYCGNRIDKLSDHRRDEFKCLYVKARQFAGME